MSMKILSPAGSFDSLKMAVYNGADEVYLGVKDFNARNNIEGFDLNSLKQAVDFAHIYGVKVFLTVNILFTDEEMQSAVDLIVDAYNLGVDAFIIQDVGLASIINKNYPFVEMHASTQMGIHNLEGVKEIEKLGFKRVCLARETPLNEIDRIHKNSKIEIEYFIQGALCVSFSGNCYLSSYLCDASGNRGKCKQLCRLPYDFYEGNKKLSHGYLLSAKDFCMIDRLNDLKNAGVTSLKIEGRARRPYYVGVATNIYRRALDGEFVDKQDLELAFNRGYTEGYFNGNSSIISNYQNHIGIEIGEVEKVKKGNKFNEIFISSNREISKKSILKFYDNDLEVATLTAFDITKRGNLYRITTTQNIKAGWRVNLILDYEKEQKLLSATKKIPLKIDVSLKPDENIKAKIFIKGKQYEIEGEKCLVAKNCPITKEEIIENFSKTNYFEPILNIELDKVFLTKQKLNEFRRKCYEFVENVLTNVDKVKLNKIVITINSEICELKDYEICDDTTNFKSKYVIYSPEEYEINSVYEFKDECQKENRIPILNLPNFALEEDIKLLKNIVEKTKIAVMVNNMYGMNFDTEKFIGGGMNIYNSYSAKYFNLPYITAETGDFKMPYMTLRHCPIKEHAKGDCANCKYNGNYYYIMDNGKKLKLKRVKMTSCIFCLT